MHEALDSLFMEKELNERVLCFLTRISELEALCSCLGSEKRLFFIVFWGDNIDFCFKYK